MERYAHNIAALAKPPQEASGEQPSLDWLLKGPADKILSCRNATNGVDLFPMD